MLYPHYYFSKPDKACIAACQLTSLPAYQLTSLPAYQLAGDAMCAILSETPLTPLLLSVYNLQSPPASDIKIDIETVEKLIGEIIAQPLR